MKNILAIKKMLHIALNLGDLLHSSWKVILESISQLDYFQSIAKGGRRDNELLGRDSEESRISNRQSSSIKKTEEMTKSENLIANIEPDMIDRIFSKSASLEANSILEFITFLCQLSISELYHSPQVRLFCMQKIVEVADCNMNRIKIIWSKIWNVIQEHFSKVGCHPNPKVALYAIDSLKQLSIKFLQVLFYYKFNIFYFF